MIRSSWPWKSSWRSSASTAWRSSAGRSCSASQRAALEAEQVGGRAARHQVAVQDRLDLVLQPGALPDDVRPARDLPAQRLRLRRRRATPTAESRPPAAAPAPAASTLSVFTFASAIARVFVRVGHHHPADVRLEQPGDRVRVARRLDRDLVLGARLSANSRSASGVVAICPAWRTTPVLPDRDLRELAMHIQPDTSAASLAHLRPSVDRWETGGQTTPTDPRSQRIRASRRGGQLLTRARSPTYKNGLPDLRLLPDAPVPDGRTVLTSPDANRSVEAVRGHSRHLPPFIPDTNAIEALNRQLRKAVKTKGHFPTEDAARKLLYLAIQNAVPQWTQNPRTGRPRCWRSRSTSETAYPTEPNPPTQLDGHPRSAPGSGGERHLGVSAASATPQEPGMWLSH